MPLFGRKRSESAQSSESSDKASIFSGSDSGSALSSLSRKSSKRNSSVPVPVGIQGATASPNSRRIVFGLPPTGSPGSPQTTNGGLPPTNGVDGNGVAGKKQRPVSMPPLSTNGRPNGGDARDSLAVAEEESEGSSDDYEEDEGLDEEEQEAEVERKALADSEPDDRAVTEEENGKEVDNPDGSVRRRKGKPLSKLTLEDVKLTEDDMKTDLKEVWTAMHLFMNSRMIEAEDICLSAADHRLYFAVGYALIQCIKSLMTFEPSDLEAAILCCRDSLTITQILRKKDGLTESMGRLVRGSIGVGSIKAMTPVQRHAELIYAECLLLKAVIGIIYSGDFIAFLKEALNMRSAYSIYRTLDKFVELADADYKKSGKGKEDPSIDQDFRSGVFLGNGMISLILSLLPSKVLKIMEVFGFTGDREYALRTLQKAGDWKVDEPEPGLKTGSEGIRRQVCDMNILMYHLVISSYLPVTGIDMGMADKVLHYNLKRYPEGVFFLYFAGRLYSTQTLCEKAIKQFNLAINSQKEYIQLQHICHWDMALTYLALGSWKQAYACFNILLKESNWSKAIYAYAKAATLYESGLDTTGEALKIMKTVPDLMQRIAGKSIPLEKFVARKAKKFVAQGGRLVCPAVELAYVLNCLGMAPRFALFEHHLDVVSTTLSELHAVKDPKSWGKNGDEFWDDYALAHLLRGIILRFIAHPEPHIPCRPAKSQIPVKEADEQAMISLSNVIKHGREVHHDHYVVYFAHYEKGRLHASMGDKNRARAEFTIVMDGKNLEISHKKGKGKVSLQNMCVLRSNAALQVLDGKA